MYQILITLDNLDEPVFPQEVSSFGVDQYEANREYSDLYLASLYLQAEQDGALNQIPR